MKETEYAREKRQRTVIADTLNREFHREQCAHDLSNAIVKALTESDKAQVDRENGTRQEAFKELIAAIRQDALVGNGSCSVVDECMEDSELFSMLDNLNCKHAHMAVNHARDIQENYLERALDCRAGEDNDPQLIAWNEWKEKRKGAA
jgi:hypothetical protein